LRKRKEERGISVPFWGNTMKKEEREEVEERGGRKVEKKKKPKGKSPLLQEKKTDAGAHEMERSNEAMGHGDKKVVKTMKTMTRWF